MRIYNPLNKQARPGRKRRRWVKFDRPSTPKSTIRIGRTAVRSFEPTLTEWDALPYRVADFVSPEEQQQYSSFFNGFDSDGKLSALIAKRDRERLAALAPDALGAELQRRIATIAYLFRETQDLASFTGSRVSDVRTLDGWFFAQCIMPAANRAWQEWLRRGLPVSSELRTQMDAYFDATLKVLEAQRASAELTEATWKAIYYTNIALIVTGAAAIIALIGIGIGAAAATIGAAKTVDVGLAVAKAGTGLAIGKGVASAVTTAATIGAGLAAASTLSHAFGNAGVSYVPPGTAGLFENKNIPSVIELAFADAGRPYSEYLAHRNRVRRMARKARRVITRRYPGQCSAIAGFGGSEVTMADATRLDPVMEMEIEGKLRDYAAFEDAFDIEPGTPEAYMIADMYDLEAYRDPHTHFFLKKLWKGVKKIAKKVLPFAAFIPGIGTAIAGIGGSLISKAVGFTQKLGLGALGEAAGAIAQANLEQGIKRGVEGTQQAIKEGVAVEELGRPLGAFTWSTDGRMIVHPITSNPEQQSQAERIIKEFLLTSEFNDPRKFSAAFNPPATAYSGVAGKPLGVFTQAASGRINTIPVVGPTMPASQQRAMALLNQFTSNSALQGAPFTVGGFNKSTIVNLSDATVGLGSTTGSEVAPYLSPTPLYASGLSSADTACGHLFDRPGAPLPRGEFYRSSMLVARLSDLPSGVYGQIRVGEMPYTIDINRNSVDSRAKVSFVHETLHGITELLKLGLSHDQLHALSVFITSEVLPGYLALSHKIR